MMGLPSKGSGDDMQIVEQASKMDGHQRVRGSPGSAWQISYVNLLFFGEGL